MQTIEKFLRIEETVLRWNDRVTINVGAVYLDRKHKETTFGYRAEGVAERPFERPSDWRASAGQSSVGNQPTPYAKMRAYLLLYAADRAEEITRMLNQAQADAKRDGEEFDIAAVIPDPEVTKTLSADSVMGHAVASQVMEEVV